MPAARSAADRFGPRATSLLKRRSGVIVAPKDTAAGSTGSYREGGSARARRRSALKLSLGYWSMIYVLTSVRTLMVGISPDEQLALAGLRVASCLIGAASCLLIWLFVERLSDRPFWQRAGVGGILSIVAAVVYSLWTNLSYHLLIDDLGSAIDGTFIQVVPIGKEYRLFRYLALDTLEWLPMFLAWGGLSFSQIYSFDVREREQQIHHLKLLSHQAQMRALRYQINPHFLFNSFNVISALVLDGKNDLAERMLLNLSLFFRSTLVAEAIDDVALGDEIEMQRLYLSIEEIRFGDRMRVVVDVPADLRRTQVPNLILQPLVENAVKYGVGGSDKMTTIHICAWATSAMVYLDVRDDGQADLARNALHSTGTGLRNVRERLATRFGSRYFFSAARIPESGYLARIGIPIDGSSLCADSSNP